MKRIIIFLNLLLSAVITFGQIQIEPEKITSPPLPNRQAKIKTDDNKPFWIGTGGHAHIHLDSSANHKVGIGVGINSTSNPTAPINFTEHAKVHIRHEWGIGNLSQAAKGPHLLLDESTADRHAVLRFRQSTVEMDENGINQMIPGARYWDIRGFANSTNSIIPWGDELLFYNSALDQPVLSITGNGFVGINRKVPDSHLHVNGDALIQNTNEPATSSTLLIRGVNNSIIQMGEIGQTSGYGELEYDISTDALTISTDQDEFGIRIKDSQVAVGGTTSFNPSSALDVHGYTQLGESSPKIKMDELSITMPLASSATEDYPLPVDASKILNLVVVVEDNDVSPSNFYTAASFFPGARFSFYFTGTTLYITTFGQDVALSGLIGSDPAKVFITYKE